MTKRPPTRKSTQRRKSLSEAELETIVAAAGSNDGIGTSPVTDELASGDAGIAGGTGTGTV